MPNQTKHMLSLALKELLARNTIDKITIGEITDLAQVSRKTFYYHFQDIRDLIEWICIDEVDNLLEKKTQYKFEIVTPKLLRNR